MPTVVTDRISTAATATRTDRVSGAPVSLGSERYGGRRYLLQRYFAGFQFRSIFVRGSADPRWVW